MNQSVDNFGGYGLSTSPGWVGNTMTWTGTNPDGTVGKLVETKVSDTKETFVTWANTKKGQPLVKRLTQTCSKS